MSFHLTPAQLQSHAVNISNRVSPFHFTRDERITIFNWLDTMIRTGTTQECRKARFNHAVHGMRKSLLEVPKSSDYSKGELYWFKLRHSFTNYVENSKPAADMNYTSFPEKLIAHLEDEMSTGDELSERFLDFYNSVLTLIACDNEDRESVCSLLQNQIPDLGQFVSNS